MAASPQACPSALRVEVRTVSGRHLVELGAEVQETVGMFKWRVMDRVDADLLERSRQLSLVCRGRLLPDSARLGECLDSTDESRRSGVAGRLLMTLVCQAPSGLAQHLEALEEASGQGTGVADLTDEALMAEHETAVRHQPLAAQVCRAVAPDLRARVVFRVGMASRRMRRTCPGVLVEQLLHSTVRTLDRFLHASPPGQQADEERATELAKAAFVLELKLQRAADNASLDHRELSTLLGSPTPDMSRIWAAEREILKKLEYMVDLPTPFTFLLSLMQRLSGPGRPDASLQAALARMLLELALLDVETAYAYPPALLAGAALSAALLAAGPPGVKGKATELDELRAHCETVVDDLGVFRVEAGGHGPQGARLRSCTLHLLGLWQDCLSPERPMAPYCAKLLEHRARVFQEEHGKGLLAASSSGAAFLEVHAKHGIARYHMLND